MEGRGFEKTGALGGEGAFHRLMPCMGPTTTTMVCSACDYPLDGLASSACPECGHAFDRNDPETFRRVLDHPMDAWTARDQGEALRVRDELEAQGVPAVIDRRSGMDVFGMGAVWAVCVSATDVRRAAELLKVRPSKAAAQAWKCPACGEQVDAGFELCWQCGADRTGRTAEDFKSAVTPVQPRSSCAKCGYLLRGLTRSECPECGAPFDPAPRDTPIEPIKPIKPDAEVLRRRAAWTRRAVSWWLAMVASLALRLLLADAPPPVTRPMTWCFVVSLAMAMIATTARAYWGGRHRA